MDYKDTLNLPTTGFPMRANLANREPVFIQRWNGDDIYHQCLETRKQAPVFTLHDGPPYANGNIHIGHVLNKVLKDFVVKYKIMSGYQCQYVPGWDCHGLPIELQVDKELKKKKKGPISTAEFRKLCREYAQRFVHIQSEEFQRLGILGAWEEPYLTMDYAYEAAIAKELGRVVANGGVFRGKKPVYWCASCKTALAEAEVEYDQHTSPSIYVAFRLNEPPQELVDIAGGKPISVAIWTTTPWTIPANLAIALHPKASYCLLDLGAKGTVVVAEVLSDFVAQAAGQEKTVVLGTFKADILKDKTARHPIYDRDSLIVTANFVTMETGTGCVHVAPGHGADDYELGRAHGLDAFAPVDDRGRYTEQVPQWEGTFVFDANPAVVEYLKDHGALLNNPGETVEHSYPHCWRCKKPIVFRATEQWFISMATQNLREKALEFTNKVEFIPKWGKVRIQGMLENRPDWCISRQRTWGVPIPAAYCTGCNHVLMNADIINHVASLFEKHGADIWFHWEPSRLLPPGTHCPECQGEDFELETDILDVWWDSGVSWSAVLEGRLGQEIPCDLYLEGSDQHRGWFQSSLLAATATRGKAPYRAVLTHGFTVDGMGRKMSKSLGNVISPNAIISKNGAEILRLWVAAEDYRDDVRVSNEILSRLTEAYRKIRNTFRYLLGNLADFDPDKDGVPVAQLCDLDRWALGRLQVYLERVNKAYESYEFHQIYHATVDLCAVDLSAFYLDVLKDRIYASGATSPERRSAQTVMWHLAHKMVRALAPIMVFTAEDIWDHLPKSAGDPASVHLAEFPKPEQSLTDPEHQRQYARLKEFRTVVLKALEQSRQGRTIGSSLEAETTIVASAQDKAFLESFGAGSLADLFIVSGVHVIEGDPGPGVGLAGEPAIRVEVKRSSKHKCERCWRVVVEPKVNGGAGGEGAPICKRCQEVLSP